MVQYLYIFMVAILMIAFVLSWILKIIVVGSTIKEVVMDKMLIGNKQKQLVEYEKAYREAYKNKIGHDIKDSDISIDENNKNKAIMKAGVERRKALTSPGTAVFALFITSLASLVTLIANDKSLLPAASGGTIDYLDGTLKLVFLFGLVVCGISIAFLLCNSKGLFHDAIHLYAIEDAEEAIKNMSDDKDTQDREGKNYE